MKIKYVLLCVILVVSLVSLSAQTTTATKDGLQISNITTIHGTVRVNLPSDIMAGDMISGTVRVEPKGSNERKKNNAAKALSGYSVRIGNKTWTTGQKPQQWTVPNNATGGQILATVVDSKGNVVTTFPVAVNPVTRANLPKFSGVKTPGYLRSGYANLVSGSFDGNAENTAVSLGEKPIAILAESPAGIVCEVPQGISGPNELTVIENGVPVSVPCNVVGLELSIDKMNLTRGENATVFLQATGMQNLDVPVNITIDNFSPQNVNLQGGAHQIITINPNDVGADGSFSKNFKLTAYQTGGFSISCVLNPPPVINTTEPSDNATLDEDGLAGLTNPTPSNEQPVDSGSGDEIGPSGNAKQIGDNVDADGNINLNNNVVVPEEDIQEERNKAREIPEDTPLTHTDPDDKNTPYSRPIPPGIRTPEHDQGSRWKDIDKLLEDAREQVEKAKDYKGPIVPGIPGYSSMGTTTPHKTITTTTIDLTCTEKIYYFYQKYFYVNDRTLLYEEQLSPSHPFSVGRADSKIDFTITETGLEVVASATGGKGSLEFGVSVKYWDISTKISGKASSRLRGRDFWLFHVGRLYLVRKAYLEIEYEYHYRVCSDGTSRTWVNTAYTNNSAYWYEWEEELFVAFKDDEDNFHRINAFPNTIHTEKQGEKRKSNDMENLDR